MTSFTEIDLVTEDLDWFAVDSGGEVGAFMSAGTRLLPSRVIESREDLERVCEFFEGLPRLSKAAIAPEVEAWRKGWMTDAGRREQSEGCLEWAERGLYSFDVLTLGRKEGPYYMVAFPESPLLETSLPPAIAEYLAEFRFPFRFRSLLGRGIHVKGEVSSLIDSRLSSGM